MAPLTGVGLALTISLYAGGAAADELTSRRLTEVGLVKSTETRLVVKASIGAGYVVLVEKARKHPRKMVRIVGQVVRFGLPAGFAVAAVRNARVGSRP